MFSGHKHTNRSLPINNKIEIHKDLLSIYFATQRKHTAHSSNCGIALQCFYASTSPAGAASAPSENKGSGRDRISGACERENRQRRHNCLSEQALGANPSTNQRLWWLKCQIGGPSRSRVTVIYNRTHRAVHVTLGHASIAIQRRQRLREL